MAFAKELRDITNKAVKLPYKYREKIDEALESFREKCMELAKQGISYCDEFVFLEIEENRYVPEAMKLITENLEPEDFAELEIGMADNNAPFRIVVRRVSWWA